MAIAFNAAADLGNSGSSPLTASYTAGSGANRLLVVPALVGTGATISGVTYAGASMTQVVTFVPTGSSVRGYFFYLLNPTSGANNVVVTTSGSSTIVAGAADYTGAAQSGQPDNSTTHDSGGGSATSITTSLTTVADNCWTILATFSAASGVSWTAGSGSTLRTKDATFGFWSLFDSNAAIHPAGSNSMTATIDLAEIIGSIMVSFSPVAATPSTVFRRTLSQFGTRTGSRQVMIG